jgi:Methyltransferase domain
MHDVLNSMAADKSLRLAWLLLFPGTLATIYTFSVFYVCKLAGCITPKCQNIWREQMEKHAFLYHARSQTIMSRGHNFTGRTAYDVFEPTYTCQSEYRRGQLFGDGGKFVCGNPSYFRSRKCLVYSVGSNGDVSFESDAVKAFGCEVHTFDPTGNTTHFEAAVLASGATFHPIGVAGVPATSENSVTNDPVQLLPLQDIIDYLGHSGRHIDILKIDCEGCEYDAFASLWSHLKNKVISIGQMQIELHFTDFARISDFFEGAHSAGFMVFHKERNQWGCDGYLCVEFSLIHADEARRIYQHEHC